MATSLELLLAFFALYFVAAWLFPRIPVNANNGLDPQGIPVYVLSNGVHTDLVLPVRACGRDWCVDLPFAHTLSQDTAMRYVAFGWGDKGFYLNTPTWADLKASTAFNAMFGLSTTAMHVTYHKQMSENDHCRKALVSAAALKELIGYIDRSFQRGKDGRMQWISGHSYERNDAFYEAKGTYNLFFTCNSWANDALKQSGLPACLWTPFDTGLLTRYAPN